MKNRVVLVTGSTDGIGKQTAIDLAKMGASVIVHGRNIERSEKALVDIRKAVPKADLDCIAGDFGSLKQIKQLSEEIHKKYDHLDVLINNAGVYKKSRELTEDGFEMTFAINHLAPFYLTGLLLGLIIKSDYRRIVNVASMAHADRIDFDNLQSEKNYDAYNAYAQSKLCNILFTVELAEKIEGKNVLVNCLHPGVIKTKLLRVAWTGIGSPVEEGSKTSVFLASHPGLKVTGKYFVDRKHKIPAAITTIKTVRRKLWEVSEELTGFDFRI